MRYVQVKVIATLAFTWAAMMVSCVAYAVADTAQSKTDKTKTNTNSSAQATDYGSVFRNPNPIAVDALEKQAADVYQWLIIHAAHKQRLLSAHDVRVRRIRAITHRLIPYSSRWNDQVKNWQWQINVIRSPQIRVDCLLGGKIIVYSGLLSRLQLNDDEIAMLLSHQIAHALREHARVHLRGEPIALDTTPRAAPQLMNFVDASTTLPGIGVQLLSLRYSHTDEIEADVIGADIAARAGYDPRAAITVWQQLIAVNRETPLDFVKMHPFAKDRIGDLKKRLADSLPLYAKAIGRTVDRLPAYDPRRVVGAR